MDRGTGRYVRAAERLSLAYRELSAKENTTYCGSVSIVKKEVPDPEKASLLRE